MARPWTDEELYAAVEEYMHMLRLERTGEIYDKVDFYRSLAERFDRTAKSFEFRAQNISHVLSLLGREWIPGLAPARNVGSGVLARIERILSEVEGEPSRGEAVFEDRVRRLARSKGLERPKGNAEPDRIPSKTTAYVRDEAVKAWVLHQADGICEACGAEAPFATPDGMPFLEVHHVRHLSGGGSDRPENAVAVCPNCHRALHYAADRHEMVSELFDGVSRLIKE